MLAADGAGLRACSCTSTGRWRRMPPEQFVRDVLVRALRDARAGDRARSRLRAGPAGRRRDCCGRLGAERASRWTWCRRARGGWARRSRAPRSARAVAGGDLALAARLLGRPYFADRPGRAGRRAGPRARVPDGQPGGHAAPQAAAARRRLCGARGVARRARRRDDEPGRTADVRRGRRSLEVHLLRRRRRRPVRRVGAEWSGWRGCATCSASPRWMRCGRSWNATAPRRARRLAAPATGLCLPESTADPATMTSSISKPSPDHRRARGALGLRPLPARGHDPRARAPTASCATPR